MAVKERQTVEGRGPENITRLLRTSYAEWQALPDIFSGFKEWPEEDQIDFVSEWPKTQERLNLIIELHDGSELNSDQIREFNEIVVLVNSHRPLINEILHYSGVKLINWHYIKDYQ